MKQLTVTGLAGKMERLSTTNSETEVGGNAHRYRTPVSIRPFLSLTEMGKAQGYQFPRTEPNGMRTLQIETTASS